MVPNFLPPARARIPKLPDPITLARCIHRTVIAISPGTEHLVALTLAEMAIDCATRYPLCSDMPTWQDNRRGFFLRVVTPSGLLVPGPKPACRTAMGGMLIGSAYAWDLARLIRGQIAVSRKGQWEFVEVKLPT